jgi:hypothetical protein
VRTPETHAGEAAVNERPAVADFYAVAGRFICVEADASETDEPEAQVQSETDPALAVPVVQPPPCEDEQLAQEAAKDPTAEDLPEAVELEAVEQGRQPEVPVRVVHVDGVDAGVGEVGGPPLGPLLDPLQAGRVDEAHVVGECPPGAHQLPVGATAPRPFLKWSRYHWTAAFDSSEVMFSAEPSSVSSEPPCA